MVMETFNLMAGVSDVGDSQKPELILPREDQIAVIPFTPEVTVIAVHYLDGDANRYYQCGGIGCLLCRAGRKLEKHGLMPVWVPCLSAVAILPMKMTLRPGALIPQMKRVLDSGVPSIAFIQKTGWGKFEVTSRPLTPTDNSGAVKIEKFKADREAGKFSVADLYEKLSDEQILAIPQIELMLRLKGALPALPTQSTGDASTIKPPIGNEDKDSACRL